MKQIIEIIVPCYNEEQCVELFYNKICAVFDRMQKFDFIITFIDDGSKDATLNAIKDLSVKAMIYFFFKELREGICHLCRFIKLLGGLYCCYGCRFTASAGIIDRND